MSVVPERDPLAIACELVGRFLFHFAQVERGLDEAIVKLFELKNQAAADIITAEMPFNRKIQIIKSMVHEQSSNKPPEWEKQATKLLHRVNGLNDPLRQTIAHSLFEPSNEKGSVVFKRTTTRGKLKQTLITWDKKQFKDHFKNMDECTAELAKLAVDLRPVTFFFLGF
jgi:hypothetical protein